MSTQQPHDAESAPIGLSRSRSLDDWYIMINRLYLDRNFYRDPDSVYSHLVEIVGGLSLLASEKSKPGVSSEAYFAKAIGWWLALCGKLRIRSVESLLWSKFPGVCPYCAGRPHVNNTCKPIKLARGSPDWTRVAQIAIERVATKPPNIGEWYRMFSAIYEVQQQERYDTVFPRLCEEMCELAEAVRLFEIAPGFFFSEAADFFAWLMHYYGVYCDKHQLYGVHAEHKLADLLGEEYPSRCKECKSQLCVCPPVLRRTVGRIAREMPLRNQDLFSPAPLLTFDQAMDAFQLSSKSIELGGQQFEVTAEVVRQIYELSVGIERNLKEQKMLGEARAATVMDAAEEIRRLAQAERATQDSIDRLARSIASMPSETRSVMMGWLTNLAAAPWCIALEATIRGIAG